MTALRLTAIAAGLALVASPALARHRHHHFVHADRLPAPAYGYGYPSPYAYEGGWQAEVIARAAAAQQASPGLTEELAPDAKETATGGPVGGVPGFSGR